MSHPYRPETDQVEKAQQAVIEQIHLESRLARARPATGVDEVTGHALADNAIYRTGAAHQINVDYRLGPERVIGTPALCWH